eukprot:TRINITY_DN19719_c0_g1_i1.p3 TRINITY_DN19719_c0_g1~~TRINITY_DN19719_c0_g1_i1.p3  ORF type:complete len:114 (+),score=3.20 TRINITY_DN19719_c0_g1_i1:247-588(+)
MRKSCFSSSTPQWKLPVAQCASKHLCIQVGLNHKIHGQRASFVVCEARRPLSRAQPLYSADAVAKFANCSSPRTTLQSASISALKIPAPKSAAALNGEDAWPRATVLVVAHHS